MIDETLMMHGSEWPGWDPAGWWMSEKLDGCRAYWDGNDFWTRGGNIIKAPAWLKGAQPKIALDGEIWAGRGRFTKARVATQFGRFDSSIQFVTFDCPNAIGTWDARMNFAQEHGANCIEFRKCLGFDDLFFSLQKTLFAAGEGLILQNPFIQAYERKRTASLLKVKIFEQFPQRRAA